MEKAILFKKGRKATIIAAGSTVVFAIAKAVAGFISGSVVLMADAIHSAADSFSAFFVWIGLKIAQKKPTEKFPYGFYKVENITALIISFLILFAGYEIFKESIERMYTEYQLNLPFIAIGVALLDAIIMFLIGSYEIKTGKKINSQSLIADGKESRMHLFSSLMVLIGLGSAWFKIPYLEGLMGIFISLFIFKMGVDSVKDSVFALMDVSPSKEIEKKVKDVLNGISSIKAFENLKLRKAGPFIFGEVRARIGKTIDVKRANEISEKIEKDVRKKVKSIDLFTVSFEPFKTKKQKIALPIDKDKGIDSYISPHFGRAKKFIFIEIEKGQIKNFYTKDNPYKDKEIRAGLNTVLFVSKEKIDSVITKEMGPISIHALRDNIVDIYLGTEGSAGELIKKLLKDNLKIIKEPTKEKL